MNYVMVIYDESGVRVAAFRNATNPTYTRSKNSADQVSFSIPRLHRLDPEDVNYSGEVITFEGVPPSHSVHDDISKEFKGDYVRIGRRFELLRSGGNVEVSGYVSECGFSGEEYIVEGFTDEILLSRYETPPQYGYALYSENATLDTFVENLRRPFVVERVKRNWADYEYEATDVLYLESGEPLDFVYLDGDPGSEIPYPDNGTISFRFQLGTDETWERFRWVADYADDVQVDVRWRTVPSPGANDDTYPWSPYEAGALTDVVGISLAGETLEYLEVQFRLSTNDNDVTPRLYAVETIKRGAEVFTTDIAAGASDLDVPTLQADSRSFIDVLIDAIEPSGWEFSVYNNEIRVSETLGSDRTNEFTLVES